MILAGEAFGAGAASTQTQIENAVLANIEALVIQNLVNNMTKNISSKIILTVQQLTTSTKKNDLEVGIFNIQQQRKSIQETISQFFDKTINTPVVFLLPSLKLLEKMMTQAFTSAQVRTETMTNLTIPVIKNYLSQNLRTNLLSQKTRILTLVFNGIEAQLIPLIESMQLRLKLAK